MPRFRLTLEYDGTPYLGWQAQPSGRGVQDAVERAILTMTGERIRLMVAGRTDAGVHALAQVAQADLAKDWRTDSLRDGLNTILAQAEERVSVLSAEAMPETWNARLSARRRHYLYRSSTAGRRSPSSTAAPGMCRAGSMPKRCIWRRSGSSDTMISRPSAPPPARRRAP